MPNFCRKFFRFYANQNFFITYSIKNIILFNFLLTNNEWLLNVFWAGFSRKISLATGVSLLDMLPAYKYYISGSQTKGRQIWKEEKFGFYYSQKAKN